MLFSSSIFLFVFLPCVLMGYYILLRNRRQGQNLFLLVIENKTKTKTVTSGLERWLLG